MKYLLYIIIIILASISSFALTINESNTFVTVVKDQTSTFCVAVTNDANVTWYNTTMTNFPNTIIPQLNVNETENLCYNVTRSNIGTTLFTPIVYGYYVIPFTQDPVNIRVLLTQLTNTTKKISDTIEFCNNFASPHTIHEGVNVWSITLQPNQCQNVTGITYTQEVIDQDNNNQIGLFTVTSNIVNTFARVSAMEKQFNLYITTVYPSSRFNIIKLIDNITTLYGQSTAGVLEIKNDENAVSGATITMDWAVFDNSTFNIGENETKYFTYRITPNISYNMQTNKTYSLNIHVNLQGFKESNDSLSVYVPYFNIEKVNETICQPILLEPSEDQIEAYLKTNRGQASIHWYCFDSSPNGTRAECQFYEKIYLNLDLNETLRRIETKLDNGQNTIINKFTELDTGKMLDVIRQLNLTNQICANFTNNVQEPLTQLEIDNQKRDHERFWWIFGVCAFVILIIAGLVFYYINAKKKKQKIENAI